MINYWVFHLLLAVLFLPWLPCFKCDSDGSMVFVKDVVTDEETSVVEDFSDGMSEHELFVPSEVWQKVKPGQALPSGLHYRINLQTGEKEAKLLDGNDHNVESGGKTGWFVLSRPFCIYGITEINLSAVFRTNAVLFYFYIHEKNFHKIFE